MPDPLHPAVVHFPIVLILLGTLCSVLGLFPGKFFPRVAALVFVLAVFGTQFASETGEHAAGPFLEAFPHAKPIFKMHTQWADWTTTGSIVVGFLALVAAFTLNSKLSWLLRILTVFLALGLSFCVYKTAEYGGWIVYGDALKISENEPLVDFFEKAADSEKSTVEQPTAEAASS